MENANLESSDEIEQVQKVPLGFRGVSSSRLINALGVWEKLATSKVEVKHLERILHLPEDKACIIAASHVTDVDMPIIGHELGSYFNLVLANQSTQHSLIEDALSYSSLIAGGKSFRPIDYQPTSRLFKNSKIPRLRNFSNPLDPQAKVFAFNPDNFYNMCKDLDEGKTVMIAAHKPSQTFELDKGGVGGAYLAQIHNAALLPVAVRLSEKGFGMANIPNIAKSIKRRRQGEVPIGAEVLVGEPIVLPPIPKIENLKMLTDKQKRGEVWTEEETGEFRWLTEQLRWQSEFVQSKIAELYES